MASRTAIAALNRSDGRCGWKNVPVAFSHVDGTLRVTEAIPRLAGWVGGAVNVKVLTRRLHGDRLTDIALTGGAAGSAFRWLLSTVRHLEGTHVLHAR